MFFTSCYHVFIFHNFEGPGGLTLRIWDKAVACAGAQRSLAEIGAVREPGVVESRRKNTKTRSNQYVQWVDKLNMVFASILNMGMSTFQLFLSKWEGWSLEDFFPSCAWEAESSAG